MKKKIMAGMALSAVLAMAAPLGVYAADVITAPAVSYEDAAIKTIIDNAFAEDKTGDDLTRGLMAYTLWELSGKPVVNFIIPFNDVKEGSKYAEAIRWAASEKIISGYENGSFSPNGVITREQLAAVIYRYMVHEKRDVSVGENTNILSYTDFADVSEYAIPAVQYAFGADIFDDYGSGLIRPKDNVSKYRAEKMLIKAVTPEKNEVIANIKGEKISVISKGGDVYEINSGSKQIKEHWNCLTDASHRPTVLFTDLNGDNKNELCVILTVSDSMSEHTEGIAVYDKDTLEELVVPSLPEVIEGLVSYSGDNKKCNITIKAITYEIANDGEYGYIDFARNTSFTIKNGKITAVSKLSKGDHDYCGTITVTFKPVEGGFDPDIIEFKR